MHQAGQLVLTAVFIDEQIQDATEAATKESVRKRHRHQPELRYLPIVREQDLASDSPLEPTIESRGTVR